MTARRRRVWHAFSATVGFLAGMAVASVLSMLFRAGAPAPVESGADRAAAPATSEWRAAPAPDRRVAPPVEARPSLNDTAPLVPPVATDAAIRAATENAVDELRQRRLEIPVQGATREQLTNTFNDPRGDSRRHEALDLLAPRRTPVVAVEDGTIAKLFNSVAGGITVYQFDPTTRYAYYYAHLDRYADGLSEGDAVKRGQMLGYVGTSGNAPENTPHLHFAIFALTAEKRWWQGTPIDPFEVLR